MGIERLAAVLQGVHDNYDIDLFGALIRAIADLTGVDPDGPQRASHRVIADHLRASAFLVADGVLPSNEGRGYVLRRIMRRAMRHAQQLGAAEPLMWRLVPALVREMGQAYPELVRAEALIAETLRLEEKRFRTTLARGLAILEEETSAFGEGRRALRRDGVQALRHLRLPARPYPGRATRPRPFGRRRRLQWGHGAPARGGAPRLDGVWRRRHRDRLVCVARTGRGDRVPRLRDRDAPRAWCGLIVKDGVEVDRLDAGEKGSLILNQTPFYGESGGQVGDVGEITAPSFRAVVADTRKKLGDLVVHDVAIVEGSALVGAAVELSVDHAARTATRANHSATHILHEALRLVLGDHVAQKGSLVSPERLRFDFAHPKAITPDELVAVEDIANRVVLENAEVTTRLMNLDDAREAGARALFGEKYGDEVRVVSHGTD